MADEQGVLFDTPEAAVTSEIERLIRAAEHTVTSSAYRPYVFRIIRRLHPEITADRWRAIANVEPDTRFDPVARAEQQAGMTQRERDVALLQEYGYGSCCDQCDRENLATIRARYPAEAAQAPVEAPETVERTCECDECTDDTCQGECDQCEDHGCEQCYGNHNVSRCCGYCEDCETHVEWDYDDRCTHCNHCPNCDHYCE